MNPVLHNFTIVVACRPHPQQSQKLYSIASPAVVKFAHIPLINVRNPFVQKANRPCYYVLPPSTIPHGLSRKLSSYRINIVAYQMHNSLCTPHDAPRGSSTPHGARTSAKRFHQGLVGEMGNTDIARDRESLVRGFEERPTLDIPKTCQRAF